MIKVINGKAIEFKDIIHHSTSTKFKFLDRIKILFGKAAITYSEIYTKDEASVLYSEAKTFVEPFMKQKSIGMEIKCEPLKPLTND